jgi:guanylate kinase
LSDLFVISAPSGAGKSTLLGRVLAEVGSLRFSISHTTRAPRAGERHGVQYYFVDRVCFEGLARSERLLEWAEVHGNYYGTGLEEYERAQADGVDLLLDVDVQGAALVRARFPQAVSVFVLPPSYEHLERRLRGRAQDGDAAIAQRLRNAREELRRYAEYDYVVVNDDLERCVREVTAVITATRRRRSRMEPVARQVLATFES